MPSSSALFIVELDYQADSSLYFEPFANDAWACFLDSSSAAFNEEQHNRFDIITAQPWADVSVYENSRIIVNNHSNGHIQEFNQASPFSVVDQLLNTMTTVSDEDLPFTGGALGFWGYELVGLLEPSRIQARGQELPLMGVGLYHWALISDHQEKRSCVVFHPDISADQQQEILKKLDITRTVEAEHFQLTSPFTTSINEDEYSEVFDRVQDYILAGDTYEVNLTQEFTAKYSGSSWSAYKHLRTVSPAPYSAFINHPDITILSHSPERFIKVADRKVETHPIKGTRPRGVTPEEDQSLAEELLSSQKDQAENLMIVDLLRNDLGRVCKTGSIEVPRLFGLESYANVHHMVSTVTGELADDHSLLELMESAFPGGSVTGAPKIRSMEIIRELEASARSVYCGSIGYISCNGNMDTSITIRTIVANDNTLHCWGGGAIVADSDCHQEYQESITKVKNLMRGLEQFALTATDSNC
ncbi:aminodeoxychorismate synthase, component I [Endozoicomonas sp. OPT23]|uniref:aminodeoxychorismate synthase component I n=1 Tax=Endozoicomonas sp. OPT23 TaxID=2072845 RepID=UPI00129ABD00|nr:aminodeoxychorismate synthase component I [Endozoicomonas sp. OPT23]MRI34372.1 aminodeoxychorismate synthase, component I [Endozoicomonas sp. OPT23]